MIDKNKHKKQCTNCKSFKFYYEERLLENGTKLYPLICVVCGQQLITDKAIMITKDKLKDAVIKAFDKYPIPTTLGCTKAMMIATKAIDDVFE